MLLEGNPKGRDLDSTAWWSTPGELDVDKFLGLLSLIYKLGKAGYISNKLVSRLLPVQ